MQIDNNKNNSFYISEPNENEKTSKGLINFDSKLYLILFFFLSFYFSSSSCIGFLSNKITNIIIFLLLTQLSISFLFIFNIVVTFICYLEKFLYYNESKVKNSYNKIIQSDLYHAINGELVLFLTIIEGVLYIGYYSSISKEDLNISIVIQIIHSFYFLTKHKVKKLFIY